MEGEGTATILLFVGAVVLVLAGVVAWQLIKRSRSDYTYQYQNKK